MGREVAGPGRCPRGSYAAPVTTATPGPLRRAARAWHLTTAVAVTVGLVWQAVLVLQGVNVLVDAGGSLPAAHTRLLNFASFFTIESNVLVAVTAAVLAVRPDAAGRVWRVLRLQALFGITVTGVVYSSLLRGVVDLHGAAAVTNALLHYVTPVLTVLGWLVFGPRPRITERTLVVSMTWPVAYVVWTFVHGAWSGWYPYPFVDVTKLGYPTVIRNGVGLVVFLVGVGALYRWLDQRLPRRFAADRPAATRPVTSGDAAARPPVMSGDAAARPPEAAGSVEQGGEPRSG